MEESLILNLRSRISEFYYLKKKRNRFLNVPEKEKAFT